MGRAGVIGFVFLVLLSFLGPVFYHGNAYSLHLLHVVAPPSAQHPLGTDGLGRDVLARLMLGGQPALEVGCATALVAMLFGTVYGMASGLFGGAIDSVLMRIVDVLLSIPALFFLLFVDSVFKPTTELLVFVLAAFSWFGVSRLVRAEVLSLKTRDYVEAARAAGAGSAWIMLRVLLPNLIGTVLVASTFQVADAILILAVLSYLGMGLPPPIPNWGGMLAESVPYMYQNAWWLIYPAGLMLLLTELSINFIGDALRVSLDTRVPSA